MLKYLLGALAIIAGGAYYVITTNQLLVGNCYQLEKFQLNVTSCNREVCVVDVTYGGMLPLGKAPIKDIKELKSLPKCEVNDAK